MEDQNFAGTILDCVEMALDGAPALEEAAVQDVQYMDRKTSPDGNYQSVMVVIDGMGYLVQVVKLGGVM